MGGIIAGRVLVRAEFITVGNGSSLTDGPLTRYAEVIMDMPPVIVWFRQDLRLSDNPALLEASLLGIPVIPLYIHAPGEERAWPPGAASLVWREHSLASLDRDLHKKGSRLIVRTGGSLDVLLALAAETGARTIHWNRRYEPSAMERDQRVEKELHAHGFQTRSFNASLLFEPDLILTSQGTPYRVFTPYWKACLANLEPGEPLPAPRLIAAPHHWPFSDRLSDLHLAPHLDWTGWIHAAWTFGEQGAGQQLETFLKEGLPGYDQDRDFPGVAGVSRLSPYLHQGEMSPRQIWSAVKASPYPGEGYLRQLVWREFAHHLLYHFPETVEKPLQSSFRTFPWRRNKGWLKKWQEGQTGYPIVDAGMRELWSTGWMHNRVRMVVASFLVKDLLIPWQEGAKWFWDTLVDADLANNTFGWQWTAGCGADAAPYFRIFNPVTQGERFDPEGSYVRRWVPELVQMPAKWLHQPWKAPAPVLAEAGVCLGKTYPHPLVDHAIARGAALEAYQSREKG